MDHNEIKISYETKYYCKMNLSDLKLKHNILATVDGEQLLHKNYRNILIVGPNKEENSLLAKDILFHHKDKFSMGLIITKEKHYDGIIPDVFMHEEFTNNLMNNLLRRQTSKKGKELFIIIDDVSFIPDAKLVALHNTCVIMTTTISDFRKTDYTLFDYIFKKHNDMGYVFINRTPEKYGTRLRYKPKERGAFIIKFEDFWEFAEKCRLIHN